MALSEKTTNPNGKRVDVKGPIADLALIKWEGRKVYIAFDSDALTKDKIRAARNALAEELKSRGAVVWFVTISSHHHKTSSALMTSFFETGQDVAFKLFDQAQRAFEVPIRRLAERVRLV